MEQNLLEETYEAWYNSTRNDPVYLYQNNMYSTQAFKPENTYEELNKIGDTNDESPVY